ncbi:hypothetical protein EIN_311800 [Entamoeba invadens IP1]|uniref:tRNA-uridine aminocarboxypropyltransferase 1 n=1 Tax=Entamoeba invadens IP1 TaxID=370355 RepID=A0A0A1TUV1_ENTIV|nr:hypothetical protein EIN_311800 [Entamoeba invadens IP1]ELP83919.1 hypothetical protein EIN_311800 [Entamoeba invadens IP1]|eukprot:XP_004183265.1 hypothetical protein EIN_311800 [Entamoeba invadens IP1]
MSDEFLSTLRLSSSTPLEDADKGGRVICPICKKSMKYFCYNCRKSLLPNAPQMTLPIKLDIVHHPTEKTSKSTALTACVLAPQDATWVEFPDEIPEYDSNETLLLFPSEDAKKLSEIPDLKKYKRVVCIESVWDKANAVKCHKNLVNLPKAVICAESTLFWRYQHLSDANLSTIEAIYYFYRDYYLATIGNYTGQCDDLLYYFVHIYKKVQGFYNQHPEKSFAHKDGYIKYTDKIVENEKKEEEKRKREEKVFQIEKKKDKKMIPKNN